MTLPLTLTLYIGWDLTAGHLLPVGSNEGGGGSLPLLAARTTTAVQGYSRVAEPPSHFTMHFFGVGGSLSKYHASELPLSPEFDIDSQNVRAKIYAR